MPLVLANITNIFASPTEVFENLKEKPYWFPAFVIISIVTIGIAFFRIPLTEQITQLAIPQSSNKVQALAMSRQLKYIGLALGPLTLLLRWLVFGAVLYFSAILLGAKEIHFKHVYVALVFSEMILLLMGIINILLVYINGIDAIRNVTDLQAVVGLDYFLSNKSRHFPLFTLLNSINIFNIWYVATLTIGVSVLTNFGKIKSAIIVTTIWLFGVGFQVALSAFFAGPR